ncbi:MAG: beta-ketoacyl-[acyl-carrier-protein] synthase family protein [Rhodobacter sp.]|nr:beta-ketoacyl-[acyl-carrier-protein] synthase family protein [Rhodobacter sp.]
MMGSHRVVITGLGALSACGAGAEDLWRAARDGVTGVATCDFERIPDQKVGHAAFVSDDMLAEHAVHVRPRMQDRVSKFALVAAEEAVQQAGFGADDFGEDFGVIVGSGFGGAQTLDENYWRFYRSEGERMDPLCIPKIMTNAAASWISMTWGATGPVYCNSTACSSAGQSIGLAYQMVKAGIMRACITGGTEACVVPGVFRAWEFLRVLSADACRPFSRDRNGMVLGEGAGILVIETLENARARGATVLAEIVGYGTSSDAGDLLRPDPVGAAASMSKAIADAGVTAADIGYVNAHGTATVANDVSEAEAMRRVFGDDFNALAVSSTKPVHGHALGAAGALESIVSIGALRDQLAPPNLNFSEFDPKVGFEPVVGSARPIKTRFSLSNSFAFGGINASLVFALPES